MGNVITRLPNVRESHLFCRPFDCSFLRWQISGKYNADVDEGEQSLLPPNLRKSVFDFENLKLVLLLDTGVEK